MEGFLGMIIQKLHMHTVSRFTCCISYSGELEEALDHHTFGMLSSLFVAPHQS